MAKKIVIFGDSILRPIVVCEGRYKISDKVDWQAIENRLGIKIENRSRMGATISRGIASFTEYLNGTDIADYVLIEFGGNDCDYDWVEISNDRTRIHLPKTSPEDFEKNLNTMIDLAIEHNVKPIMMNLPPVSSHGYYTWLVDKGLNAENIMHHLKDIEVISRKQEFYSGIVTMTALKRGIPLVDVRRKFLNHSNYISLICKDGLHPNPDGGRLIADAFIEHFGC